MSEADVGFIGGAEESEEDDVPFRLPGVATLRGAFASLDDVNLVEEFDERGCVMKSVPRFMNGPYRIAMRVALEEMNTTGACGERVEVVPPLAQNVVASGITKWTDPETKLMNRLELFRGAWRELLEASRMCSHQAAVSAVQNLSCTLAPGSEATLNALRDPEKRPQFPRHAVRPQFEVSQEGSSWRSIRHDGGTIAAVAGPSSRSQEFHPCKRAVVTGQSFRIQFGKQSDWGGSQPFRSPL